MRMLWAKKRARDDPEATPWLGSIPLPAEDSIRTSSRNQSRSATTGPKIRREDSSSRSKTPHASSSNHLSREVLENPRPRTTSATDGGRPNKGILKPSKPADASGNKKPLAPKNSEEQTTTKSRGRTSSLTNGVLKGILKPSKSVPKDDYLEKPVIPTLPSKGGSLGLKEDPSACQKPGMKGGGKSYPSSKEKDSENTSSRAAAYPERHGQAPPSHYYSSPPIAPRPIKPVIAERLEYHTAHSGMPPNHYPQPGYAGHSSSYPVARTEFQRTASYAGYPSHPPVQPPGHHRAPSYTPRPAMYPVIPQQAAPYAARPGYGGPWPGHIQGAEQQYRPGVQNPADEAKYVPSGVTRKFVPGKPEDISLSWPFIDPATKPRHHQRWKLPQLFFDVGMDPTDDTIGIRAYLTGCAYTRPLTADEKILPVSSHCVVTKMEIYCEDPHMKKWPVIAVRAEGLRTIDVFEAIYKTFAVPLTPEDLYDYRPEYLNSCVPAFKQRCKDGPGLTEVNEARGLCRVDLFRTQKIFKGLSKKGRAPAWTLTLDRPQGPL